MAFRKYQSSPHFIYLTIQNCNHDNNLGNDLVEILSDAIKSTRKRSSPQPGQLAPCGQTSAGRQKAYTEHWGIKPAKKDSNKQLRWPNANTGGVSSRKPKLTPTYTEWQGGRSQDDKAQQLLSEPQMVLNRTQAARRPYCTTCSLLDLEHDANRLPWSTEVTEEEARWAATSCQDKAPGADNITVRLLRAAWPAIGQAVRTLYEGSLRDKHFPAIFKLA
ncbi:hypothetical protein K3495_g5385 [Podosphaera aphanis]|nr:hypothetical protein K3495_g5385 [Podosphaera aphanis]